MRALCTVVLATVLALPQPAWSGPKPTLEVDPPYPQVGQPATVTLKGASNATLKVTYRPASQTEATVTVGPFRGNRAQWTPDSPGVTRLSAMTAGAKKPLATVTVSTRFASAPVSGLLVMVLAGLILLGGAAWSMRVALRS